MVVMIIVIALMIIIALGYFVIGIEYGMFLHSYHFLRRNCKETMTHILKPGILIEYSQSNKTGFGDYEMSFNLLNPETREKVNFDIVMQINGTIVNIDKYELRDIKDYVMDGVDLEKYLVKD